MVMLTDLVPKQSVSNDVWVRKSSLCTQLALNLTYFYIVFARCREIVGCMTHVMTNRCSDVGPISPANVAISLDGPSLYKKGTNTTRMKN